MAVPEIDLVVLGKLRQQRLHALHGLLAALLREQRLGGADARFHQRNLAVFSCNLRRVGAER